MKKLIITALIMMTSSLVAAATYTIDPIHSTVEFKVKHMMVSNIRGQFGEFSGTLKFDAGRLDKWSTEATIQITSIDTDDQKRDDHLRSVEFFDVEKYPTMIFKSTGVMKHGDVHMLHGDLTLHGVTKPIVLNLEYNGTVDDPWGNTRVGFSAQGKIDRRKFGVSFDKKLDKGGLVVGNAVTIYLEIEAILDN